MPESGSSAASESAVLPLRYAVLGLALLAVLALVPLWAPLAFAVWTASLLWPFHRRVSKSKWLSGRERAAGFVSALVVLVMLVPLAGLVLAIAAAGADLSEKLRESKALSDVAQVFVPSGLSVENMSVERLAAFARRHGTRAAGFFGTALGVMTALAIGVVVYVFALYESFVRGPKAYSWLLARAPLPPRATARLSAAFLETGRGLFLGIGGTALLQGAVATIGYVIIGVPQALLLGLVTTGAALIPSVGTALVWVPVAAALFIGDRPAAGTAMLVIGSITAVVDNFVRPWLSKFGHLKLPMFVIFVAMLGGVTMFGGFGLVLGPLFVRLAVEAFDLWRESTAGA